MYNTDSLHRPRTSAHAQPLPESPVPFLGHHPLHPHQAEGCMTPHDTGIHVHTRPAPRTHCVWIDQRLRAAEGR